MKLPQIHYLFRCMMVGMGIGSLIGGNSIAAAIFLGAVLIAQAIKPNSLA